MSSSESTPEPTVTYFDRNGDTRLLLDGNDGPRIFVVSREIMTLVCDSWDRMLSPDGHFSEAREGNGREICLPDDDADGLEILLNIAHLHFDRVPQMLEFQDLLAVAVLTEKYEVMKLIKPWVAKWVEGNKGLVDQPGHEEWLWVAWAFGEADIFEKLSMRLMLECSINENGLYVTPRGRVLDPESVIDYFPPDIMESIVSTRDKTIRILLEGLYSLVDRFLEANTKGRYMCKCPVDQAYCDSLIFGSLCLSIQKAGLGPFRHGNAQIRWSVDKLWKQIMCVRVLKIGESNLKGTTYSHRGCSWQNRVVDGWIRGRIANLPSCVLDSHRAHMARKRTELTETCSRRALSEGSLGQNSLKRKRQED